MSEHMLTANRHPAVGEAEAELVLVERTDEIVRLVLDDGEILEFDATELDHAIEKGAA